MVCVPIRQRLLSPAQLECKFITQLSSRVCSVNPFIPLVESVLSSSILPPNSHANSLAIPVGPSGFDGRSPFPSFAIFCFSRLSSECGLISKNQEPISSKHLISGTNNQPASPFRAFRGFIDDYMSDKLPEDDNFFIILIEDEFYKSNPARINHPFASRVSALLQFSQGHP